MLLPLRGGFCESSQIPWALPSPRTLPLAGRLSPFQGVHGWCAPKGQQTDSKGQRPVAIGEDGEIGKMMNVMVCWMKHNMVLPLRGGFCESSQIPWALPSPRTLPLAGRLSPFQGVHGWCAPKGQLSGNTVCNAVTKLRDAGNDAGMCAPKGQPSGSPMATPWTTITPLAMETPSATITPLAMETSWTTITPLAMETPSATITPVSATNEKYITAPKGHKQKGYGTITM